MALSFYKPQLFTYTDWMDIGQPPEITTNPLSDNKTLTRPIRCVSPVCPPFSPLSISPPHAYEPTVWRDCNPSGLHCKLGDGGLDALEVNLSCSSVFVFAWFIYYNRDYFMPRTWNFGEHLSGVMLCRWCDGEHLQTLISCSPEFNTKNEEPNDNIKWITWIIGIILNMRSADYSMQLSESLRSFWKIWVWSGVR